jgi:hypothetical protein
MRKDYSSHRDEYMQQELEKRKEAINLVKSIQNDRERRMILER